jgi:molybdopterin-guanine dinucleotide biosynthesis protein A
MIFAGDFTGAVLAGGNSTRMGTDKAFLRVGNELLLERQLRLLREAGATELLISGRTNVDYSGFDCRVVYDEEPEAGPLAGIAAVLQAASPALVMVLAVDLPAMTATMLHKILSYCEADTGCVPFHEDGFEPLAAAYPKAALPLAARLLATRSLSMQTFVRGAVAEGLLRQLPVHPSERVYFGNWNRPGDWIQTRD